MALKKVLFLAFLFFLVTSSIADADKKDRAVTYDSRSLIINGQRELLFSGSIHYPRMTVEMWPDVIKKAKEGGLNVIQTYVFWNLHEPEEGKWVMEGNGDIVKFIKMIAENDMYVTLRLGPFIQAEWNHGGLPYWLREKPNITFRCDNEPFKFYMEKYTKKVLDVMKEEKLFFPQGGPIIMAQIENEYNTIQLAYKEKGTSYIQWAANLALDQNVGVPWVMCKQKDAPGPVINTCNGRHCGETFIGPNAPNKPSLWTENWTAQFRVFGDPPSQRAAEDISYAVARFFSKNGSLVNYYMYYGGTNYGRTTASFTTTRYYDEAPLDEFGLRREPKFGHLADLHRALRLSRKALLWGTPNVQRISRDVEIIFYEKPGTEICVAFLNNNHTKKPEVMHFRGQDYYVPPKSISILPDCKTIVYNTQTIVSQHNARNFHPSKIAKDLKWEMSTEPIPDANKGPIKNNVPMELYNLTKDTTDYAWYTTSITFERQDLPMRSDILPVLQIANLGHAMAAFVNGEYIGFGHGSHVEKSFVFEKPINLKSGVNQIALLGMLVGLPDSGAYMERRYAGVRAVTIQGLNAGTLDVTQNEWSHDVGVNGEKLKLFTEEGAGKVKWTEAKGAGPPLTWYKTYFDAPEGKSPVALRMVTMGKGAVWVNGLNIGRYWVNYLNPLGQPTQSEYHIPRAWLKPTRNLLVVFEETGGNPTGIEVQTVNRDTICSLITEYHPPNVDSWEKDGEKIKTVGGGIKTGSHLACTEGKVIKEVEFASYGDPEGVCGGFTEGKCRASNAVKIVEELCLGKASCFVPMDKHKFEDKCPAVGKVLAIQARCGRNKDDGKSAN